MKIESTNKQGLFSFFFQSNLPFSKKGFLFRFSLYNAPNCRVCGYSSRTQTGQYVLFHDFDELELQDVIEELKYLQKKFCLSDYYIFQMPDNPKSIHCVCLDAMPLSEAYEIQKHTSCDQAFIHAIKNLKMREWVLRFSEKGERKKPVFVKTVFSNNFKRIKSSAHAEFLLKWFNVKVRQKGHWDKKTKLGIIHYNTANRTKKT